MSCWSVTFGLPSLTTVQAHQARDLTVDQAHADELIIVYKNKDVFDKCYANHAGMVKVYGPLNRHEVWNSMKAYKQNFKLNCLKQNAKQNARISFQFMKEQFCIFFLWSGLFSASQMWTGLYVVCKKRWSLDLTQTVAFSVVQRIQNISLTIHQDICAF